MIFLQLFDGDAAAESAICFSLFCLWTRASEFSIRVWDAPNMSEHKIPFGKIFKSAEITSSIQFGIYEK